VLDKNKNMLETSKDLLYIVIAFCVLWLTVFMCWTIYYVAMLLKQAYDLTRGFRNKLERLDDLMDLAKRRLENSGSHLALMAEGVGQLVKYLVNKKTQKTTKKKK